MHIKSQEMPNSVQLREGWTADKVAILMVNLEISTK